ncbi:hypothetical protein THTE_3694 [Thermogutta terrifontis]|uniref:Uncharacterized protein n=1 Tax=Thermogutta terrifontis TaxID=1331910 RepID=A0A286RJZ5_9BACT|nr:hypothetical protein THTE_3694 [Thermogutta terrifontis]
MGRSADVLAGLPGDIDFARQERLAIGYSFPSASLFTVVSQW